MQKPIYLSDLVLLRDIFSPEKKTLAIFDPYHRLTVAQNIDFRLLQEPIFQEDETLFYVDLTSGFNPDGNVENALYAGLSIGEETIKIYFINNPDGTMRWLFLADDKHAGYLSLYNTATWKGRFYKKLSHLAWKIGQEQRLASGVIYLQQNLLERVKQLNGVMQHESVSFFTGTRGATRKTVMEIHDKSSCSGFVKIPLTKHSKSLVQNEIEMLTALGKYDFTTLSLPKLSKKINGNARISNVKPGIVISADRITSIHAKVMAELYNISHERKMIMESVAWHTIINNMEFLKQELLFSNGLNTAKTKRIIYLLTKVYNSISVTDEIAVSVSHGDFTPWNMYCDDQRLYVYDWELARNGIPMLFDLYHFTFQSTILQHQKKYNDVIKSVQKWQQTPLIKQIVHKYKINTALNYRLYLLFNVSYYLRQYINETELLTQSQWMMDAWLEALEDITHIADNSATNV